MSDETPKRNGRSIRLAGELGRALRVVGDRSGSIAALGGASPSNLLASAVTLVSLERDLPPGDAVGDACRDLMRVALEATPPDEPPPAVQAGRYLDRQSRCGRRTSVRTR